MRRLVMLFAALAFTYSTGSALVGVVRVAVYGDTVEMEMRQA